MLERVAAAVPVDSCGCMLMHNDLRLGMYDQQFARQDLTAIEQCDGVAMPESNQH